MLSRSYTKKDVIKMKRKIYNQLLEWKNSPNRKPLILYGARQTGKTWILKEFGSNEYNNLAYINCDNNPELENLFSDFDIDRIIRVLSAYCNEIINKDDTLIVLDEIQEIPLGITALKYFCENAPEYHIVVAGSFLGMNIHKGTGFPVGKVDEMRLYPLSFKEFLMACDREPLIDYMQSGQWLKSQDLSNLFKELLRQYYFVGGMPEAVKCYVESQDIIRTRKIQKRILSDYKKDFSKHIPAKEITKVEMVWDSLPSQLAKENKKFIYGALKKGARAKEFEDSIKWLEDAGLVYKVKRVNKVAVPIAFYEDFGSFKLFMSDIGLLCASINVPAKELFISDNALVEYKGALTEQYVCQQIVGDEVEPYYYSNNNSTLEIDFVIQTNKVYPIEVKAEENLMSKSLKSLVDQTGLKGWRFSMSGYRDQDWMVNVPLYMVEQWIENN